MRYTKYKEFFACDRCGKSTEDNAHLRFSVVTVRGHRVINICAVCASAGAYHCQICDRVHTDDPAEACENPQEEA